MYSVDFLKSSPVPKWGMINKNKESNSNPQWVYWIKDYQTTIKHSEHETLSLKMFHLTHIARPWLYTGQSCLLLCIVTPHRSILSQEKPWESLGLKPHGRNNTNRCCKLCNKMPNCHRGYSAYNIHHRDPRCSFKRDREWFCLQRNWTIQVDMCWNFTGGQWRKNVPNGPISLISRQAGVQIF